MVETVDISGVLALSDADALVLITKVLEAKPQLAPSVAQWMIPDLTLAPARAITDRRHVGIIKGFDAEKGFGFVDCPAIKQIFGCDVWLHHEQLGNFTNGAQIEFAALLSKDGKPQAFGLSLVKQPPKAKGQEGLRYTGTIKQFQFDKGFGFIECQEISEVYGRDTWLHHAQLQNHMPGETVDFTMALNKDGHPQAIDLTATAGGVKRPRVQEGGRYVGLIKAFLPEKQFGFIECPELFAMYGINTWVCAAQLGTYQPGETVEFTMTLNKQGKPQAQDLGDVGDPNGVIKRARKNGEQGIRYSGTITEFSLELGCGMIDCPELQNIYGGPTLVLPAHMGNFQPGHAVEFTMAPDKDGNPWAIDLCEKKPIEKPIDTPHWLQPVDNKMYIGMVKSFQPDKGFGFIDCPALRQQFGRDVWVHHQQMRDFKVGDQVGFQTALSQQGHPQAINLQAAMPTTVPTPTEIPPMLTSGFGF